MRCPRCGHEAEGMARACPSCGYMLPFSLRQARQLRTKRDTASSLPTSSGKQPPDGPAIAPELPRNDPTGAAFIPETPARPQPSVISSVPLHSRPTRPTLQPIPDAEVTPASLPALLASQPTPTAGSSRAFAGPDDVATYSDVLASTTSAHAALSSGTLLQGGRYRLLWRFRATAAAGPAEESEPPLFVASDTEHPKQRVLVQELP